MVNIRNKFMQQEKKLAISLLYYENNPTFSRGDMRDELES